MVFFLQYIVNLVWFDDKVNNKIWSTYFVLILVSPAKYATHDLYVT